MSTEERNLWAGTGLCLVGVAAYTMVLLRLRGAALDEVEWGTPLLLLLVVGGGVFAAVMLVNLLTARRRHEAIRDERDEAINRYGELAGKGLLDLVVLVTLILLALEVAPFWVAHMLLYGSTLSALTTAGAKLGLYRQGLPV